MKTYQQTTTICEKFYSECLNFWKREKHDEPEKMALTDVARLERDPFSPSGDELDRTAVNDFVKSK